MGVPDFICSPTEKWPARSTLLPLRVPPWPLPGLSLVAVSLGTVPLADFQPLSSPCVCTWTDVWPQASPSWLAPQIAHPQNKSPSKLSAPRARWRNAPHTLPRCLHATSPVRPSDTSCSSLARAWRSEVVSHRWPRTPSPHWIILDSGQQGLRALVPNHLSHLIATVLGSTFLSKSMNSFSLILKIDYPRMY